MTVLESIETLLAPLASGGCWPMIAAQGTTPPYLTYQRVISTTENTLQGATTVQNTRLQVDAYAKTYADAQTLSGAVKAALAGSTLSNIQLTEQDFYEPDVKLYRVSLDVSLWSI